VDRRLLETLVSHGQALWSKDHEEDGRLDLSSAVSSFASYVGGDQSSTAKRNSKSETRCRKKDMIDSNDLWTRMIVTGWNVLLIYEIGETHVETRLFFINADNNELMKLKKCHGRYLNGMGNNDDENDCLEWLDKELEEGKFKSCSIKMNQIATLEKEDVPIVVIITGHAL
jgi:hypothetical protein